MLKPLQITTIVFSLVIVSLFSECYSTYAVISQEYKYDDDVTFTIDKVQEGNNISTGNGSYYAKRGFKFVFVYTTIKNNSNEKKKLDFGNIYLLEPKSKTKYKVEFAMMETAFNMFGRVDSEIQKNDTKKRKLVFTYPKDEKAGTFSVNDVIYNISYSGTTN